MTIDEVRSEIRTRVTRVAVAKIFRKLESQGTIAEIGKRKSGAGRPASVYTYLEDVVTLLDFMTDYDIEQKHLPLDEKRGLLLEHIVRSSLDPTLDPRTEERFEVCASRLSDTDPKDLFLGMAEWLIREHKKSIQVYRKMEKVDKKEAQKARDRMTRIQVLAHRIFNKCLGIPRLKDEGPLRISYDSSTNQDTSIFDTEGIMRFLQTSVIGERVIETKESSLPNPPYSQAGTDASLREIRISEQFPRLFEPIPMAIITSVSVRNNLLREDGELGGVTIDAKPEPRTWRLYPTEEALSRGLLLTPDVYLDTPAMWNRSMEAAMNLRQYWKDDEVLSSDPLTDGADILIRDGRIFPWEHRFSDFLQYTEHGRLVRMALYKFGGLVGRLGLSDRTLYCGVVKSPAIEILAPLVFWYMGFGSAEERDDVIWPDMDERFIFRCPMSDQRVALRLFEAVRSQKEPDERWVTCRFVRRFSSMAEDFISSRWFEEEEEWVEYLGKRMKSMELPTPQDVNIFAQLCAKAAVMSFYMDPGKGSVAREDTHLIVTPRYEVLLPHTALGNPERLSEVDKVYVRRILEALADSRALDVYPEEAWK